MRVLMMLVLGCVLACAPDVPRSPAPAAPEVEGAGLDWRADRVLYDAIVAQRPHLLSGRGGARPLVIINGGMPEPIEVLDLIRTRDVIRIERRSHDPTQPGNVATLRITVRWQRMHEEGT